jgi:hypothetical protein
MGNSEICHDGKVTIFKIMGRIIKSMFFYVSVWKRVYVLVEKALTWSHVYATLEPYKLIDENYEIISHESRFCWRCIAI